MTAASTPSSPQAPGARPAASSTRSAVLPLDPTGQLSHRTTAQPGDRVGHGTGRSGGPAPAAPPALVLVAHGSRDPRTPRTVRTLLERVRELRPGTDVRLGHIELNEPLLSDTLAKLAPGRAVLVPLLLSRGYHVKHDLPRAAAAAPHLRTAVAAPLGPHPLLVEALYARLVEAGWRTGDGMGHRRAVVLAAAGSRDPDSAVDARRTARQLGERLGGVPVVPAYACAATPSVPDALRALAARGRDRTAVASYFTAPGRFATRSAEHAPWIAAAPLGAHPAMARLVLHRYDQAPAASGASTHRQLLSA